jgi:hypothetical protein
MHVLSSIQSSLESRCCFIVSNSVLFLSFSLVSGCNHSLVRALFIWEGSKNRWGAYPNKRDMKKCKLVLSSRGQTTNITFMHIEGANAMVFTRVEQCCLRMIFEDQSVMFTRTFKNS